MTSLGDLRMYMYIWWRNNETDKLILSAYSLERKLAVSVGFRPNRARIFSAPSDNSFHANAQVNMGLSKKRKQ